MGVALDFTTITILSMLLGVAADNTIHLRWAVRREPSRPRHDPVPWAVRRVATPATLTAATTVAGFGILVLSPFPASQRVGLFMAIGLAVAWLADMTLAPVLVSFERRRWRSRDRDGMEHLERQRRGDSGPVIAEHASHGHGGGREEDG
jgi:predicted RND superfamily exporter protein